MATATPGRDAPRASWLISRPTSVSPALAATMPRSRAEGTKVEARRDSASAALVAAGRRAGRATMRVSSHQLALGVAAADPHQLGNRGARADAPLRFSRPRQKRAIPRQSPIAARPGASLPSAVARFHLGQPRLAAHRRLSWPPPARGERRRNARRPSGNISRHRWQHPSSAASARS